jgi:hypothetical protein
MRRDGRSLLMFSKEAMLQLMALGKVESWVDDQSQGVGERL